MTITADQEALRDDIAHGRIDTRIETMKLRELKHLDMNARFMRFEQFQRLVENLRQDGMLTSVPLGCMLYDEEGNPTGEYEILSGNHRVKAAIEAGIEEAAVMLIDENLPRQRRIAIQLSHNAIAGEDDPGILKMLFEELEDVDWRGYTGFDDKDLALLEDTDVPGLSEANLDFQTVSLAFLPGESEEIKQVMDAALGTISADEAWLVRLDQYDAFMDLLNLIQTSYKVTNAATAFLLMVQLARRHLTELVEGWWDDDLQAPRHDGWVPLASIVGDPYLPTEAAQIVKRAVDKMVSRGEVSSTNPIQAIEFWAAEYLAGPEAI